MAKAIVGNKQAFKVAGGGETLELINKLGLANEFNHISTGGGAMLAFLSGEILPGIAALK
jgi:phosphoglycerate kinase